MPPLLAALAAHLAAALPVEQPFELSRAAAASPYAQDVAADEPLAHWRVDGDVPGAVAGEHARAFSPGSALVLGGAEWGGAELAAELWVKDASGTLLSKGRDGAPPAVRVSLGRALEVAIAGDPVAAEVKLAPGVWHHLAFSWRSEDGLLVIAAGGREVKRGNVARGAVVPFEGALRIGELSGAVDEVAVFDRPVHPSRWLARRLMAAGLRSPSVLTSRRQVEPVVQVGHTGFVDSIAWSPDGALVASGGGDSAVKLWDPRRGVLLRTMRGHEGEVFALAWSPDGERVISGGRDGVVNVWDPATGALLRRVVHGIEANQRDVISLAFDPGGTRFVSSARGGTTRLWDAASGALLRELPGGFAAWSPDGERLSTQGWDKLLRVHSAGGERLLRGLKHETWVGLYDWSPDATRIAASDGKGTVRVWRVEDGALLHSLAIGGDKGTLVVWSPDGERIATSGKNVEGACIWSAATGELLHRMKGAEQTLKLRWSPDGTRLAAAGHQTAYLWGRDGAPIATLRGHGSSVFGLEWSPDGDRLATGSNPQLVIWTPGGERLHELVTRVPSILQIAWRPDGRRLLAATRRAVETFELDSASFGAPIALSTNLTPLSLSPDGTRVAMAGGDGRGRVWAAADGKLLADFDCLLCRNWPSRIEWSPDGRLLSVFPMGDQNVPIHDARTGKLITILSPVRVKDTAWSPDGRQLATADWSEGVIVWDARSGKRLRVMAQPWAALVRWSADGRVIAAAGEDGTIQVWDADTGAARGKMKGRPGMMMDLALLPDGSSLALVPVYSEVASIFDVATGTTTAELRHPRGVWSFAPSRDWSKLATGGLDGTVRLWSPRGELLQTLDTGAYLVRQIEWSPDGRFLAARSEEGSVKIWDLSRGTGVTLIGGKATGWLAMTDTRWFDGSESAGAAVAMVQGLRAYEIAQLAPARNRPDMVVAALGGPAEQVAFYEALWLRRLSRMGLERDRLGDDFSSAPVAKITSVERGAGPGAILVGLELTDTTGLERYQVYVNGTPAGRPAEVEGKRHRAVVPVQLGRGANLVEVTALNALGVESLRASTRIEHDGAGLPPARLFFVGFGVSDYRDDRLDLSFAHQDARDLAAAFQRARGFASTRVETFTDREVSPAALDRARATLAEVTEHDTLVMFIAGHGARDEDAQRTYYYLDHDARFEDLAGTAIPFDAIEDLLYGARARRKLFLIDTCQSGEDLDVGSLTSAVRGARGLKARSIRGVKRAGSAAMSAELRRLWLGALRDRDRLILTDLSRRSGAIVLASSLGQESSLEAPAWRNGAFTEEILRALRSTVADANRDGAVDTAELEAHVIRAVPALTGDRQHPGVERDNPLQRFAIPLDR